MWIPTLNTDCWVFHRHVIFLSKYPNTKLVAVTISRTLYYYSLLSSLFLFLAPFPIYHYIWDRIIFRLVECGKRVLPEIEHWSWAAQTLPLPSRDAYITHVCVCHCVAYLVLVVIFIVYFTHGKPNSRGHDRESFLGGLNRFPKWHTKIHTFCVLTQGCGGLMRSDTFWTSVRLQVLYYALKIGWPTINIPRYLRLGK